MPTIEKLAENFVRAANELVESAGVYQTIMSGSGIQMQMSEKQFDTLFKDNEISFETRTSEDYPVEKYIVVGGIRFLCLSRDWDLWAKLKGYVKKETNQMPCVSEMGGKCYLDKNHVTGEMGPCVLPDEHCEDYMEV